MNDGSSVAQTRNSAARVPRDYLLYKLRPLHSVGRSASRRAAVPRLSTVAWDATASSPSVTRCNEDEGSGGTALDEGHYDHAQALRPRRKSDPGIRQVAWAEIEVMLQGGDESPVLRDSSSPLPLATELGKTTAEASGSKGRYVSEHERMQFVDSMSRHDAQATWRRMQADVEATFPAKQDLAYLFSRKRQRTKKLVLDQLVRTYRMQVNSKRGSFSASEPMGNPPLSVRITTTRKRPSILDRTEDASLNGLRPSTRQETDVLLASGSATVVVHMLVEWCGSVALASIEGPQSVESQVRCFCITHERFGVTTAALTAQLGELYGKGDALAQGVVHFVSIWLQSLPAAVSGSSEESCRTRTHVSEWAQATFAPSDWLHVEMDPGDAPVPSSPMLGSPSMNSPRRRLRRRASILSPRTFEPQASPPESPVQSKRSSLRKLGGRLRGTLRKLPSHHCRLEFADIKTKHLATQMTAVDREAFLLVPRSDLLQRRWELDEKSVRSIDADVWGGASEQAPIMRVVHRWVKLTRWVSGEIVSTPKVSKRVYVVQKFIKLGMKLWKVHNFHAAIAIVSALNGPSISRLKSVWRNVQERCMSKLARLDRWCSPSGHHQEYRLAIDACLRQVTKELTAVDAKGNPDYHGDGSLNFEKAMLLSRIVGRFEAALRQPPLTTTLDPDSKLAGLLLAYARELPGSMAEDNVYLKSLQLEPREGHGTAAAVPSTPRGTLRRRSSLLRPQ